MCKKATHTRRIESTSNNYNIFIVVKPNVWETNRPGRCKTTQEPDSQDPQDTEAEMQDTEAEVQDTEAEEQEPRGNQTYIMTK
jgi:hypothetical protein